MEDQWHPMRASALSDANDCMRRALVRTTFNEGMRERFGVNPKPRQHIAALIGTAMHRYLQQGVRDWEGFTKDMFAKPVRFDNITPDRVTCRRQLEHMADIFDRTYPDWRDGAHMIEEDLKTSFMVGDDIVELTGHPDMVDGDGIIFDLKTGRRSDSPRHAAQMGAYAVLVKRAAKRKVTGLRVVSVSRSHDNIITYDYKVDECVSLAMGCVRNLVAARQTLEDQYEGKDSDILRSLSIRAPCNPASDICTPDWCESYATGICPVTQTEKTEVLYEQ